MPSPPSSSLQRVFFAEEAECPILSPDTCCWACGAEYCFDMLPCSAFPYLWYTGEPLRILGLHQSLLEPINSMLGEVGTLRRCVTTAPPQPTSKFSDPKVWGVTRRELHQCPYTQLQSHGSEQPSWGEKQAIKPIVPNLFPRELTSFVTRVKKFKLKCTFKNSSGSYKRQ